MNPTFVQWRVGLVLAMGVALTMGVHADDKDSDETEKLDKVVVSATKTERTTDKVANSVTVITQEEIQAKGHCTVADVLRGQPGVNIVRNGGVGANTSVSIRGAASKNVLLMVDGIPYNDPASPNRNPVFSHLTTSNIERIEIIRGPQSVLFGSTAAAGVINVITKKGAGKPSVTLRTEAGSYKTYRNGVSSSGTINRLSYSVAVDYIDIGGYSVADEDRLDISHAGMTGENDAYRNLSYSTRLGYKVSDDFDIAFSGRGVESIIEYDSPPNDTNAETQTTEEAYRLDLKNRVGDGLFESNVYASYMLTDRWLYAGTTKGSTFEGHTEGYGWQVNMNTPGSILSLGVDLQREFAQTSGGIDENADLRSTWVQEQVEYENFYVSLGIRNDRHDRFGTAATWRVAPAYTFDSGAKIKASYGTGFRAPSLNELYGPWGSDPTLQPEESEGWDIGIEQKIGDDSMVGVTYFNTEYDKMIDYSMLTWGYVQTPGDTDTQGVELVVDWKASRRLSFLLNYTYTDTENDDGTRAIRQPLNQVMLTTNYKFGDAAGVNVDMQWVDERDSSPWAPNDLNGNRIDKMQEYFLINLTMYYQMMNNLKLTARIDNVTDEDYEEVVAYASPDRSYYIGAELTF